MRAPNYAFHPTAQQLRCWVPSSLRSSAAGEGERYADIRGQSVTPIWLLVTIAVMAFGGCAGANPNPGERTADMAWMRSDYSQALTILRPAAERGEPWAQLRMGFLYEKGFGVEKDTREAVDWYRKAARQTGTGGWAEGKMIGALGRPGYFNQNSDALLAQYWIGHIYFRGDGVTRDLVEAYFWIRNVSDKTQGKSLFFCCEFAGGLHLSAAKIAETLANVEREMTADDKRTAEERLRTWSPQ